MLLKSVGILFFVHIISCSSAFQYRRSPTGCGPPPVINNARTIVGNQIFIECFDLYRFPNNETKIELYCDANVWKLKNFGSLNQFGCQPVCSSACKNSRVHVEPICSCPENVICSNCGQEKKRCPPHPAVPRNSKMMCTTTECTITCSKGHTFPDGSSMTSMICNDGEWAPTRSDQALIPDCKPTCSSMPCQNGGTCVSYNRCRCTEEYRGEQCQFNIDVCSPSKIFGCGYNCTGDNDAVRCKLRCPENAAFSSPPAAEYVCEYEKGYYLPSTIPRCILNENVRG